MDFKRTKEIYARALFDNISEIPRELSFKKGDILKVLQENYDNNPEWWVCSLRNKVGLAPANRLEAMPVLNNDTKPALQSQISNSSYDEFPEQTVRDNCYFNIPNHENISFADDTYSAYQFPKEDVYIDPIENQSNFPGATVETSVYQIPSDDHLDETYSNMVDQTSPQSYPNASRPKSLKGTMDSRQINIKCDYPDAMNTGFIESSIHNSDTGDIIAQLLISPEEAISKYKTLQTNIVESCNKVMTFVKLKWKSEEMLRLNGSSLRLCFLELQENLVILLNFANGVYQNSLKCTDTNLTKKIGNHLKQLNENSQTVNDSLEKLHSMNWEPDQIATSVRLAVTEGSDALGQVVVAARNLMINTRSMSVTLNGNASILFSWYSATPDQIKEDGLGAQTVSSNDGIGNGYNMENIYKLFGQQVQLQVNLVNETVDDFIRYLSNRNQDSQSLKTVTSNSRFVIRSATQLVCIAKNLSETQLKSALCKQIEAAGNKLCDSLKSMANLTKQLVTEPRWSTDQKDQLNRQLKSIKDCVNILERLVVNCTV